jgi:pimeloyl-ACP methyl ester carboxylesterase
MLHVRHGKGCVVLLAVALACARADEKPGGKTAGTMVDVGGHRLHMLVQGRGTPTVILEAGFDGPLVVWDKVQPEVARIARVVAYSRAGIGESEPGPEPRSAGQIATELHTALTKAGLKPPYVLVGHSAGALYNRVFAHKYPREVAGMVFVDPAPEDYYGWMKESHPEVWNAMVADTRRAPAGIRGQFAALDKTLQQARAAWPLPDVPMVLLTATKPWPPAMTRENLAVWSRMHSDFLQRVPKARHVVTAESDHNIPRNQPRLVVDAIRTVIRAKDGAAP